MDRPEKSQYTDNYEVSLKSFRVALIISGGFGSVFWTNLSNLYHEMW